MNTQYHPPQEFSALVWRLRRSPEGRAVLRQFEREAGVELKLLMREDFKRLWPMYIDDLTRNEWPNIEDNWLRAAAEDVYRRYHSMIELNYVIGLPMEEFVGRRSDVATVNYLTRRFGLSTFDELLWFMERYRCPATVEWLIGVRNLHSLRRRVRTLRTHQR